MEIDFDRQDNRSDYVTVPEGTYLCRIAEVVPGTTRNGHPRWGVRLVVAEGEYVGRQAAWDGLVFSERGTPRVRRVLAALGLPTRGRVQVEPEDLVGRQCFVKLRPESYTDPLTQHVTRRNEVLYDGYTPCDDPLPARATSDASASEGARIARDDDEPDFQRLPF